VAPTLTGATTGVRSISVYADSPKDGTAVDAVKIPVIIEP
jgi:hypothetical protein